MEMIQALIDAPGQQQKMQNPTSAPRNGWPSTKWESGNKASNTTTLGLKLRKNDQSLVDDSRREGDNGATTLQTVPAQQKRRVQDFDHETKRLAKRQNTTSASTSESSEETSKAQGP